MQHRSVETDSESQMDPEPISVRRAMNDVFNNKLEGYLALTDSIVHIILHCEGRNSKFNDYDKGLLKASSCV